MVAFPGVLPDGLTSSAKEFIIIPNEILSEMCLNVLLFLQYQKAEVDINQLSQQLQASNVSVSLELLQRMINTLCFHYRDAMSRHLSTDAFLDSLQSLRLYSEEKIAIIIKSWEIQSKSFSQIDLMDHLNVGQLLDMDWKLSMAISSSSCKNLHAPSITLLIKVLQPNGEIVKKSFELTIDQFQNFSKQLEDTKSVLETV